MPRRATKASKESRVNKENRDRQERRDRQGQPEPLDRLVRQARKEILATRGLKERQVPRVRQAPLGLQALRAQTGRTERMGPQDRE